MAMQCLDSGVVSDKLSRSPSWNPGSGHVRDDTSTVNPSPHCISKYYWRWGGGRWDYDGFFRQGCHPASSRRGSAICPDQHDPSKRRPLKALLR